MPYIKKVRIQGFQSHLDSTFTLSPGLNVITGPSDAGKTAIIRALRWLAFNEPQGEAFIHTIRDTDGNITQSAEQATVTVEFDNGITISKTRRKGKTVYTHSAYPNPWEKAELPLEIKESLGLIKQSYGDNFDTCLNFAYQLDPPFMLSETGSTGAKVLGKLAGTEVVDKSIGVVVKQTHQTRETIRHSEKAVGQYDVELLEYLRTEENLEVVEGLEKLCTSVDTKTVRHTQLTELKTRLELRQTTVKNYTTRLEQLQHVPTLVCTMDKINGLHSKAQQLKTLAKGFWDSVNRRKDLHTTLKQLQEVPDLFVDLEKAVTANDRLTAVKNVAERQKRAENSVERLRGILNSLKSTDGLDGKINAVKLKAERLAKLQDNKNAYEMRNGKVKTTENTLHYYDDMCKTAKQSLTEAWEAAGGVCPLCNQPIKGDNKCIQ